MRERVAMRRRSKAGPQILSVPSILIDKVDRRTTGSMTGISHTFSGLVETSPDILSFAGQASLRQLNCTPSDRYKDIFFLHVILAVHRVAVS